MNFSSEISKLLTNKYFLYFMVFLAATNVLGYLVTNKLNAVIFFALIGLLTYQFSKNMAVILLIAIVATNFMMANKIIREGLENATSTNTSPALENISKIDPQISQAVDAIQTSSTNEEMKKNYKILPHPFLPVLLLHLVQMHLNQMPLGIQMLIILNRRMIQFIL